MKVYGHTEDGRVIDDAMVARLAAEMDAGIAPEKLVRRRVGRPRTVGTEPAQVVPVRLDFDRLTALDQRALDEGKNRSEVLREALDAYVAL